VADGYIRVERLIQEGLAFEEVRAALEARLEGVAPLMGIAPPSAVGQG
jgi:hypothetical protein